MHSRLTTVAVQSKRMNRLFLQGSPGRTVGWRVRAACVWEAARGGGPASEGSPAVNVPVSAHRSAIWIKGVPR